MKRPMPYMAGAALLGSAIGVLAGLLVAPKKGQEVRQMLRDRSRDSLKRLPSKLAGMPGDTLKRLPGRFATLKEQGRLKLRRWPTKRTVEVVETDDDA